MEIVEISEPGGLDEQQGKEGLVVGIDFGTTNSLIAISEGFVPRIVRMEEAAGKDITGKNKSKQNSSEIVPSIIGFDENGFKVGKEAAHSQNKIKSIKRFLAKSYAEIQSNANLSALCSNIIDEENIPKIQVANQRLTLPEVAAEIFKYLKHNAELALKQEVNRAVISVPAYFDDQARGQIMFAARLAGLEVMRLIAEPTAAAYAYGLSKKKQGTYLVYDLGGGTFDVSLLNMQEGIFQVIASGGDNMLGGDDIDFLIAKYICKELGVELEKELSGNLDIISKAKQAKEDLASNDQVSIELKNRKIILDKEKYQQIISPLIERTIKITQQVMNDAEQSELDGIILVGGSTRIAYISEKLQEIFKVKIYNDIDPDKIVAYGAAMQAENLTSKSNSLLLDVIPLSVGLELYGGITEKIILRNTPIPFSVTKEFTTHTDGQTGMKFHIVQGEREMVKDCRSLANFELTGIKADKAGKARIGVNFAIDADGILSVSAIDADSGKAHNMEIKPSYGIDEKYINEALENAYKNAAFDHEQRLLIESREEAKSMISGIRSALEETPDLLSDADSSNIESAINSLQNAINSDNREVIYTKSDYLNKLAGDFIQRHLDKGAELFLKNHHIDEVKIKE